MSDIQLAVLLAALGAIAWYVRRSLERESGPSGLLEAKSPPAEDRGREAVSRLLLGHFCSLLVCIPLLASSPYGLAEGHAMDRWLQEFLAAWLRWAGIVQLVYLVPLWLGLRSQRRAAAARALLVAGGATAAGSGLTWACAADLRRASAALQAGCGLLALASAVALIWCGRELRRCLRV